jgi:AcrR family transcriptional regulator
VDAAVSQGTDPRMLRSRDAVLAGTLELLAERGIAGTTIEAVAARTGVAKTTIYRQWDSQAALVRDAFDSILRHPRPPSTGSPRGDLTEMLTGFASCAPTAPADRLNGLRAPRPASGTRTLGSACGSAPALTATG